MEKATRPQRAYDHRLRQLVYATGDIQAALELGVPRSTACGWLRTVPRETVSICHVDHIADELLREVHALRAQVAKLRALLRLVVTLLRASGFALREARILDDNKRRAVLRAVASVRHVLPMRASSELSDSQHVDTTHG